MSQVVESLGQLLDPEAKGLKEAAIGALGASSAMAAARAALALIPSGALADLTRGVAEALQAVLRFRLGDILAGAWNAGRQLHQYADPSRFPPGDVFEVPLAEHKITSTHHPRIAILLNGAPVPGAEVEFTVELAFTIESAVLRIHGGRLTGATIAKCKGKGTLSCGDAVLLEQPTREFSLPPLSFGEGVPVGWNRTPRC